MLNSVHQSGERDRERERETDSVLTVTAGEGLSSVLTS